MEKYKVYRVETDAGVVASVVVACCKEVEEFYAEYLVLLPHSKGCRSWRYIEQTTEAQAEEILRDAWGMAKRKMISGDLSDIFKKQHTDGDDSDFDGYFKLKYQTKMAQLYAEVKCQCLKDLLNPGKTRLQ